MKIIRQCLLCDRKVVTEHPDNSAPSDTLIEESSHTQEHQCDATSLGVLVTIGIEETDK